MNYVDVHTHLEMPEFDSDLEDVIGRAFDAGLSFICTVGTEPKYWEKAINIAAKHENIYASIGLHPHESQLFDAKTGSLLRKYLNNPKCLMLGEIGLDFFKNYAPHDKQKAIFLRQLDIAEELGKPVMVHIRDAHAEARKILDKRRLRGIIHCFTGSVDDAKAYVNLGYFISIPGIVTYKKATGIHDVVRKIPLDNLLTETDAPFLTPEPFRGKRNEPAFIPHTLNRIAELKGITPEDAARTIYVNTRKAFRIPIEQETRLVYNIRNSLYLNLTNRCTNQCVFCGKQKDFFVKGHQLKLEKDPSIEDILKAFPDNLNGYDEAVFCGYGEPTLRLDLIISLGVILKHKGVKKIRLNTDGLANARERKNIVPELAKVIDSVSISLNAADEETYNKLCRPSLPNAYSSLLQFIAEAKKQISEVVVSAVALPSLDIKKIRDFAEQVLKVKFRERSYDELG